MQQAAPVDRTVNRDCMLILDYACFSSAPDYHLLALRVIDEFSMKLTNPLIRPTTLSTCAVITAAVLAITGCNPDSHQGIRIRAISAESGLSFLEPDTAQETDPSPSLFLDFDEDPFHSSATYSFFRLGQQLSYAADLGYRHPGSMRVSNRTAVWQGPLFTLPSFPTKPLTVSIWIKPLNTQRAAVAKLMLMRVSDNDGVSVPIAEMEMVPGKWQKLEGRIPNIESAEKLHAIRLEVEGADIDYLIDDVSIKETSSVYPLGSEQGSEELLPAISELGPVVNGDLEDGLEPWGSQGGQITRSREHAHSGKYSLLISGRTQGWHAPVITINRLEDNTPYRVSIYVRMTENFPLADVQLTLKQVVDGQPKFIPIANRSVSSDSWTQVVGSLQAADFSTSDQFSIYLESSNPTASYYVDNLSVEAQ